MPHRPVHAIPFSAGLHRASAGRANRVLAVMLVLLFAVASTVAAMLLGAAPAAAHDQLESSTPAEGEVLEEAPTEVVLTFSGEIETVGIEMQLTDYDGTIMNLPTVPQLDGIVVTQQLPELEDGAYTLAWRVVSSDGHPIDGTVSFLVDPTIAVTGIDSAQDAADGQDTGAQSGASQQSGSEMPPWIVVVVGLVGIVVVGAAIVGFMTVASRNDAMRERLASAGPTVSGREKTDDDDALL